MKFASKRLRHVKYSMCYVVLNTIFEDIMKAKIKAFF